MRPTVGIIRGPSLYRHECKKCREETLHNARGCVHCGTLPWREKVEIGGNARRVLTSVATKRRARW